MALPIPNKQKGMVGITLGGKDTILHSTFENMSAFESHANIGLYALAHRFGTGDIRMTDVVNIIWCFSVNRNEEGWTKDEIAQAVIKSSSGEIVTIVQSFLLVLLGVDEAEKSAATVTDTKKKPLKKVK